MANDLLSKLIEEEITVRLTFTDDILGSAPSDPELYSSYVAAKAPDAKTMEQEIEEYGVDAVREKQRTVFLTDRDGELILKGYQIKGFFKDSCGALRDNTRTESSELRAYKKKIDGMIFIKESNILIEHISDIKDCQRPLRAQTPQGERIAIAVSDAIEAGAQITFTIQLMSKSYEKVVLEWLDYGQFRGLGQWRNSGKGRFTYEVLSIWPDPEDEKTAESTPAKKRGRPKKEGA